MQFIYQICLVFSHKIMWFQYFWQTLFQFLIRNFFHDQTLGKKDPDKTFLLSKRHKRKTTNCHGRFLHLFSEIINLETNFASPNFLHLFMAIPIPLDSRTEMLRFWQFQNTPYFWFLLQYCMRKVIFIQSI